MALVMPLLVRAKEKLFDRLVDASSRLDLADLSGKILGCHCDIGAAHTCSGPEWVKQFYVTFPDAVIDPDLHEKNFPTKKRKKGQAAAKRPKKPTGLVYRTPQSHPQLRWPPDNKDVECCTIFLDEAGRGPWVSAMSVVAVIRLMQPLTRPVDPRERVQGIHAAFFPTVFQGFDPNAEPVPLSQIALHDSKVLKEHEREKSYLQLLHCTEICYWICHVTHTQIDEMGMAKAWRYGMQTAVIRAYQLSNRVATAQLVDGSTSVAIEYEHTPTIRTTAAEEKADSHHRLVAAASILGKVSRDRVVTLEAEEAKLIHPDYEAIFKDKKGYGSGAQCPQRKLIEKGIYTRFHRKSFNPLRSYLERVVGGGS